LRIPFLFLKQLAVGARARKHHAAATAFFFHETIDQQEIATDMALAIAGPIALQRMVLPFRPKRRIRRKAQLRPGAFDLTRLKNVRTVREFDEEYTAPHFGFLNAEDYYHRASAMRVIDRVRVPALIITAADDPFVPPAPFHDPRVTGNPCITLHLCDHGGHCGFVGEGRGDDDGYWAEDSIVEFIQRQASRDAASAGDQTPAPSPLLRA